MKTPFILGIILLSQGVFAQWKSSGSTGPYVNSLQTPDTAGVPADKLGVTFDLKIENKINSQWKFKSDVFLRTDQLARDAVENFQIIPKNFHLQHKRKSLTFKAGFQQMALEGPDIVNPADVVHAKNWIDPTTPITLSSAGLSMSQELDDWNWELFYVPRQTSPVLPGKHSPWLPRSKRLPIESQDTEIRIPDDVKYRYQGARVLNDALDHNLSLKVQKKAESFEGQILYYNGLSQSPFLLTNVSGTLLSVNPEVILVDSPVKLRPLYYRHQVIAGTFLIPMDSWAIRGGFNWMKPEGSSDLVPKETTLAVLGFEKSVETSLGLITGVVDYVRQGRQDDNQISFLRSVFEEAVTVGARIPFGEETQVFTGGMYDLKGQSSVYKIHANRRLSNSWSVEGGAQFLQGPDDTMIGIYNRHDSYQVKLLYSW